MTHETQTREALVELIRETLWRQTFAPDEDPIVIERQKANWPDDWARTLPKAKGIIAALEAAGVRLVPVEATEEMRQAAVDPLIEWGFMKEGLAEALRAAIAASPYAKDTP